MPIRRLVSKEIAPSLADPASLRITSVVYDISVEDVNNFRATVGYTAKNAAGKTVEIKKTFFVRLKNDGAFVYGENASSSLAPKRYSGAYVYDDLSAFG